jgi:hypothetical protein
LAHQEIVEGLAEITKSQSQSGSLINKPMGRSFEGEASQGLHQGHY